MNEPGSCSTAIYCLRMRTQAINCRATGTEYELRTAQLAYYAVVLYNNSTEQEEKKGGSTHLQEVWVQNTQDTRIALPLRSIISGSSGHRYIVEAVLGHGGYSIIYRVREHRSTHNEYALKELFDTSKQQMHQLMFEFNVLTRINHSSLPHVYRVFEDTKNSRMYVLMDYIEGDNLEQLRRKLPEKRIPYTRVLSIMEPIAEAISFLHQQEPPIVHRDIKPANIIVPESGEDAYLVDFGTAKAHNDDQTTMAVRQCTPGYGAPEQYSKGTDPRTDIYGLGATLYTLLTGRIPVDALERMRAVLPSQTRPLTSSDTLDTPKDSGSSVSSPHLVNGRSLPFNTSVEPLEPLQSIVPAVPDSMASAIHRAMSLRPEERFATVEEFWHAIHVEPQAERDFDLDTLPRMPLLSSSEDDNGEDKESGKNSQTVSLPIASRFSSVPLLPLASIEIPSPTEHSANTELPVSLTSHASYGVSTHTLPETVHISSRRGRFPCVPFLALLLGVLCLIAFAELYWTFGVAHTNTPVAQIHSTSTQPVKPTPLRSRPAVSYPPLVSQYSGTISDVVSTSTSSMTLSAIEQHDAQIQGNFVGLGLTGTFTGTITVSGHVQFRIAIYQGSETLVFEGDVKTGGTLAGSFRILNSNNEPTGEYGLWSVSPI